MSHNGVHIHFSMFNVQRSAKYVYMHTSPNSHSEKQQFSKDILIEILNLSGVPEEIYINNFLHSVQLI